MVASGRCRLLAVSSNTPNVSKAWRAVRSPFSFDTPGAMHLELVEIDATGSVIGAKAFMFAKVSSYGSVYRTMRCDNSNDLTIWPRRRGSVSARGTLGGSAIS